MNDLDYYYATCIYRCLNNIDTAAKMLHNASSELGRIPCQTEEYRQEILKLMRHIDGIDGLEDKVKSTHDMAIKLLMKHKDSIIEE